jgi:Sulfotransferase domain
MTDRIARIAMWSGPRNISTALMRSFGARPDTVVIDEPFYAAYLARTGLDHPMRAEVLAAQPRDWRVVVTGLLGEVPGDKPVYYQKHMTHHMLEDFGRDWIVGMRNAFLIREPRAVLASYVQQRREVTLADIGATQQRELFERVADHLGSAPPVVESDDLLRNPAGILSRLCAALDIDYTDAMLSWPRGRRATDGVWAPAWYAAVERSTGFSGPRERTSVVFSPELEPIAEAARIHYEVLAQHRLRA